MWATLLLACDTDNPTATRPKTIGQSGELIVVCDPILWNGATGKAIRSIYGSSQPGMPQAEPWFRIYQFRPDQINSLSRRYRNMLFVVTADRDKTASDLEKDLWGDSKRPQDRGQGREFILAEKKNHWADEQYIIYAVGRNDADLAQALRQRKEPLLQQLNASERSRGIARMKRIPALKEAVDGLRDSMGLEMHIPNTYAIKTLNRNFVWLARDLGDKSYNLLIWSRQWQQKVQQPLVTPTATIDSILSWKDRIARINVAGPLEGSYYTTEYLEPPVSSPFMINNTQVGTEIRGLWKIENDFMGGPFYHLTQSDSIGRRWIHLEGFVYYPEESKRELLRELECIIHSCKARSSAPSGS
jgi:hypothetical protein